MKNIRMVCDGFCENCESCIYDVPQPMESKKPIIQTTTNVYNGEKAMPARKSEELNYCNGCQFVKKEKPTCKSLLDNWICSKAIIPTYGKGRTIDFKVNVGHLVRRPYWCPLLEKKTDTVQKKRFSDLPRYEQEKYWEKIKPITTFKDIKEHKWYHIPPINGKKRTDVLVIAKYRYSIQVREKGKNFLDTDFIRDNSLEIKFMSEIKTPKENGITRSQ